MKWKVRAGAVLLAVAVAGSPVSPAGAAGAIEHVGGAPGSGPALQIGIDPQGLAVADGKLDVADASGVVRQIDLSTGYATVLAGGGGFHPGGSEEDGVAAAEASLPNPGRAARDAAGNLYLEVRSTPWEHFVRKIGPDGNLVTVAGMRAWGPTRDGVPATQSKIGDVYGLAADTAGNLYIGDWNRVRRVDRSGTITTYAGSAYGGFSGDDGPATAARFSGRQYVAVNEAGDLYIADSGNSRIRRIDAATGIVTTVAGGGTLTADGVPGTLAKLSGLTDLAVSADGSIVFSEGTRIRKLGIDGVVTTIAQGSGLLTADEAGNVYVGRAGSVVRVGPDGTQTPVAGNGTLSTSGDGGSATNAQLGGVASHVVDNDGSVYFVSSETRRIRVIDRAGNIDTFASPGGTGISSPTALALHGNHLYVLDYASGGFRVLRIHLQTRRQEVVAGGGVAPLTDTPALATSVRLPYVLDLAVDSAGSVYLASTYTARVFVVSDGLIRLFAGSKPCEEEEWYYYDCSDVGDGGPAVLARLAIPVGLAVDGNDNVYIVTWGSFEDGYPYNIRRVDSAGVITTVVRGFSEQIFDVEVSKEGDAIYAAYQQGYPYNPWDYGIGRITPGLYIDDQAVLRATLSTIYRVPRESQVDPGSLAITHHGHLSAGLGDGLYNIVDPHS